MTDPNLYMGPGGLSVPSADRADLLMFPRLSTYSQIVARLQWEPAAIDFAADARAWPALGEERRRRLTTLLAGFCVAEDAVAEHLTPFADVAEHVDTMMMWIFFLQRRDEDRHAQFFDRVAAEVLGLPGQTPAERRAAARPHVPPALLELFEVRLPAIAAELAAGRAGIAAGVGLYAMVLERAVLAAGQRRFADPRTAPCRNPRRRGARRSRRALARRLRRALPDRGRRSRPGARGGPGPRHRGGRRLGGRGAPRHP
jgi:hypothetical protein